MRATDDAASRAAQKLLAISPPAGTRGAMPAQGVILNSIANFLYDGSRCVKVSSMRPLLPLRY